MTWRDKTSEGAQADLDTLLGAAIGFAQEQLARHGEYYPFGLALRSNDTVELVAGVPGDGDEHPPADVVRNSCLRELMQRREQFRACAVTADVRLPDTGTDAIEVALEHAEGLALRIQMPYLKRAPSEITYSALRAASSTASVWTG